MATTYAELDASFDILSGTMFIKQKVRDPEVWPDIQHESLVQFNQRNSTFINLEGLAGNSLKFTYMINPPKVKMKTSSSSITEDICGRTGAKLRTCHQWYGWETGTDGNEGPLYQYLMDCNGEQILQLHFPNDRIEGWKSVAMILLTYRKINPVIWHHLRTKTSCCELAGFDWVQVEDRMGSQHVYLYADVEAKAKRPRVTKADTIMKLAELLEYMGSDTTLKARGFADLAGAVNRHTSYYALNSDDLGFRGL
ncbi:hypothetical protein N7451_010629 [Penicillium sp. IBT 35674x]|nr:hypothetical protein N7451_010629 [Penicillium sp. IBT 35674x]